MSLLDRYLFREWLKAFILSLAVTLAVLLLEDIQDDLPDFQQWGASTQTILHYYAIYIPTFLPVLIPVALIVSLMFTLGNLHRNNEIVAMRASGMGLLRITRSLWCASALLAGVLFYLNAQAVPWSMERARLIRENLQFEHQAQTSAADRVGVIANLTYDNLEENRRWFINRFSQYYARGYGVTVYQFDETGHETARYMASEGIYDDTVGYWILENGRELRFDEAGEAVFSKTFESRAFPEFTENHKLMQALAKSPDDLSLPEIQSALRQVPPEENPRMRAYAVRLQAVLASPFACLIVAGIAIPFAVTGVRTNPLVGVTRAGGLFIGWYALAGISRMLGDQGRIPPEAAAWLPHATLIIIAAILLYRAR